MFLELFTEVNDVLAKSEFKDKYSDAQIKALNDVFNKTYNLDEQGMTLVKNGKVPQIVPEKFLGRTGLNKLFKRAKIVAINPISLTASNVKIHSDVVDEFTPDMTDDDINPGGEYDDFETLINVSVDFKYEVQYTYLLPVKGKFNLALKATHIIKWNTDDFHLANTFSGDFAKAKKLKDKGEYLSAYFDGKKMLEAGEWKKVQEKTTLQSWAESVKVSTTNTKIIYER